MVLFANDSAEGRGEKAEMSYVSPRRGGGARENKACTRKKGRGEKVRSGGGGEEWKVEGGGARGAGANDPSAWGGREENVRSKRNRP